MNATADKTLGRAQTALERTTAALRDLSFGYQERSLTTDEVNELQRCRTLLGHMVSALSIQADQGRLNRDEIDYITLNARILLLASASSRPATWEEDLAAIAQIDWEGMGFNPKGSPRPPRDMTAEIAKVADTLHHTTGLVAFRSELNELKLFIFQAAHGGQLEWDHAHALTLDARKLLLASEPPKAAHEALEHIEGRLREKFSNNAQLQEEALADGLPFFLLEDVDEDEAHETPRPRG